MDIFDKVINENIKTHFKLDETEMEILESAFDILGVAYTTSHESWRHQIHTAFTTFNFSDAGKFIKQTPNTITEILRLESKTT